MANIKSAAKRAKQAEVRRQHNIALKSRMRTAIKKVITAIDAGDANLASEQYKQAVPEIDRMAGKGLIQANKAARHKSRLNKAIKGLRAES
ncbi:MAG TPA: 30S ribosomal protein S20 [Gammaproteobacteria bacterium]|nr:30S ribosomal protein S20 [Chromatiales bacterium]MCP4926011.1 30S ribosomal protein S20 [Gammaproteobacteria bacterium]MDP7152852.1 30S ribosomal protein S20 [Gammaproteobacteria bacterium]MDP7296967.1 30S ribosomal protein S20 [Gammaproteobacteria bacterium]MDP7661270.1 30S ribosomal protein S20 [Gammaproteobacteria bacterium]